MTANALDAYIVKTEEAAALLARIAGYIEDHGEIAPDAVTWPHVGNMGHVCELLREVVNFIGGEEK